LQLFGLLYISFLLYHSFGAHCCHIGTAVKHPVPDWVKPSFVIFLPTGHSDAQG